MDGLKEVERLIAFLRQVELQDHAGVVLPQHLGLGVGELLVHVLQVLFDIVIQGEVARLLLVIDEEEHIHEGHGVVLDAADDAAVILVVGSVGAVKQTDHFIVHIDKLGELPWLELVGERIAVFRLDVRQAHGGVDLVISL